MIESVSDGEATGLHLLIRQLVTEQPDKGETRALQATEQEAIEPQATEPQAIEQQNEDAKPSLLDSFDDIFKELTKDQDFSWHDWCEGIEGIKSEANLQDFLRIWNDKLPEPEEDENAPASTETEESTEEDETDHPLAMEDIVKALLTHVDWKECKSRFKHAKEEDEDAETLVIHRNMESFKAALEDRTIDPACTTILLVLFDERKKSACALFEDSMTLDDFYKELNSLQVRKVSLDEQKK